MVKVKVKANLVLIELLVCSETCRDKLDELLAVIRKGVDRDPAKGRGLFRMVMKSLLGFGSFADIQEFTVGLTTKIEKNKSRYRGWNTREESIQPVVLSAMSMYCHLSGDLPLAYQLELNAYELAKQKRDVVLVLLTVRHLWELARQMG